MSVASLASLVLGAALAVSGCQRNEQAQASGEAADCAHVGEVLASFEVGNYAPPDQRAAVVSRHRQSCETNNVSATEADCLFHAKDTWAARACVPTMFPATKPTGDACATFVTRMREAVMADVGSNGSAAAAQLDKILPVMKASCEEDHWPASVTRCVADSKPGDMAAFQACSNQLPPELQQKAATRMTAMLQAGQPTPPAPTPPAPAPPAPSK